MKSSSTWGFSLLEMLVTLAIMGILLGVASINLTSFWQHTNAALLKSQVISLLEQGVVSANAKHTMTYACLANRKTQCLRDGRRYLLLFYKVHNQTMRRLSVLALANVRGTLHWRAFNQDKPYFSFSPHGNVSNGSFWFCARDARTPTWAITINRLGYVRTSNTNGLKCTD